MSAEWEFPLLMRCERNADGFFGFQPEPYGGAKSGARPYEGIFPCGVFAVPLEPDALEEPDGDSDLAPPRLGASGLMSTWGSESFVIPCQDPRIVPLLPHPGLGGAGQGGGRRKGKAFAASYHVFWGDNSPDPTAMPAGSWRLRVPEDNGKHFDIEIDRLAREIRIFHPDEPGGPVVVLKSGGIVELGGPGALPVIVDPGGAFAAWTLALQTATGVAPPAGVAGSTRVKARP